MTHGGACLKCGYKPPWRVLSGLRVYPLDPEKDLRERALRASQRLSRDSDRKDRIECTLNYIRLTQGGGTKDEQER